jgi:hypothetical protein
MDIMMIGSPFFLDFKALLPYISPFYITDITDENKTPDESLMNHGCHGISGSSVIKELS